MAFQDMVDYLDSCWCARNQIVPCLIGPVGIGKTAAVNQHAINVGAGKVVTIIASQILPNEVSGITMPDAETKAMEIYDHFRLSQMKDGDILFFDELLEADQMVLKACLTLIESRELMSGRKLPDIQIVAATNPSISPEMLKENIRQRFLFRNFDVDQSDTAKFIEESTGMDVSGIVSKIVTTGKEYNILTPRSLTKMAQWMNTTMSIEEGKRVATAINNAWGNELGSELYFIKWSRRTTKKDARNVVREIAHKHGISLISMNDKVSGETKTVAMSHFPIAEDSSYCDEDMWNNSSLSDIMSILSKTSVWKDIASELDSIEAPDGSEDLGEIDF